MMSPEDYQAFMALKDREEAKRAAYLRRRFTPAELWRWHQQALDDLARLRPDLARRRRLASDRSEPPAPPS